MEYAIDSHDNPASDWRRVGMDGDEGGWRGNLHGGRNKLIR